MRQKHYSLGAVVFSVIALVMAVGLCSLQANADDHDDNFVYVMTNKKPHNSIIQFRRANDGSLAWVREVATGGSGTGATGVDPLGSQDSLVLMAMVTSCWRSMLEATRFRFWKLNTTGSACEIKYPPAAFFPTASPCLVISSMY
jgi:hypothetical protein